MPVAIHADGPACACCFVISSGRFECDFCSAPVIQVFIQELELLNRLSLLVNSCGSGLSDILGQEPSGSPCPDVALFAQPVTCGTIMQSGDSCGFPLYSTTGMLDWETSRGSRSMCAFLSPTTLNVHLTFATHLVTHLTQACKLQSCKCTSMHSPRSWQASSVSSSVFPFPTFMVGQCIGRCIQTQMAQLSVPDIGVANQAQNLAFFRIPLSVRMACWSFRMIPSPEIWWNARVHRIDPGPAGVSLACTRTSLYRRREGLTLQTIVLIAPADPCRSCSR